MNLHTQEIKHEGKGNNVRDVELHESINAASQTPPLPPMSSLHLTMEKKKASGSSGAAKKIKAVRQSHAGTGIKQKVKPRRKIPLEFKRKVVNELKEGKTTAVALANKYKIADSMIYNWIKLFKRFDGVKVGKVKKEKKLKKKYKLRAKLIPATQDALIYLQHAWNELQKQGGGRLDNPVHLFMALALRALEGK